jgi:fibronectin-binding autotransporter adhesin
MANASIQSLFGDGTIETHGYGVGGTLTCYGADGLHADAQGQFSWFSSALNSAILGKLADNNHGHGKAFSLEVGKRAPIGGKLSLTPQIQMVYAHVGYEEFADAAGAVVSANDGRSLKTRWGLSIDHQNSWSGGAGGKRSSHAYSLVTLTYEWLPETGVNVSGTSVSNHDHGLSGEIGLGGSLNWNDRITLYSQMTGRTNLSDFGKSYRLNATAGVRVAF